MSIRADWDGPMPPEGQFPRCVIIEGSHVTVVTLGRDGEPEKQSYLPGTAGGYVWRWMPNGTTQQVFGRGGAAWAWNSDDLVKQGKQIARELYVPFVGSTALDAWIAAAAGAARALGREWAAYEARYAY